LGSVLAVYVFLWKYMPRDSSVCANALVMNSNVNVVNKK